MYDVRMYLVHPGDEPGGFLDPLVARDLELAHARTYPNSRAHFEDIRCRVNVFVLVVQRNVDREHADCGRAARQELALRALTSHTLASIVPFAAQASPINASRMEFYRWTFSTDHQPPAPFEQPPLKAKLA